MGKKKAEQNQIEGIMGKARLGVTGIDYGGRPRAKECGQPLDAQKERK